MSLRARALPALSAAALLVPTGIGAVAFATSAQAGGVDSNLNHTSTWVSTLEAKGYTNVSCAKTNFGGNTKAWTANKDYVLVVVKAGSDKSVETGANETHYGVPGGTVLTHTSGKNLSHVIYCVGTKPAPQEPVCKPGETLENGKCVTPPPACDEDEVVVDGKCTPKPKPPVCDEDEVVVDGKCTPKPKPPVCDEDEVVVDGKCTPKPQTPVCKDGETLENGKCVPAASTPTTTVTEKETVTSTAPGTTVTKPAATVTKPAATVTKPAPAPKTEVVVVAPEQADVPPALAETGSANTIAGFATALGMIGLGSGFVAFSRRRNG